MKILLSNILFFVILPLGIIYHIFSYTTGGNVTLANLFFYVVITVFAIGSYVKKSRNKE